ncbi:shikimate dehydrogenase [Bartonella sp. HY406]|uniref:shikimate dehydrogenase n=1 Tax=Bartonella sp. HY406 TaxID=2979331 RepID=UPI0021C9A62F|nr:shikimate dehydrogenase [Bartonella sp. HY406]UXN03363.1 shikimate dehydrogenase [Bartonella sp. HY406]
MRELSKAFVTGYPIKHSRSPQIHRHWLKSHEIEGSYDPIEVAPDNFKDFIKNLRQSGFSGGNVTIPHKEMAHDLVDRRDDLANEIGAANTLWFEGDVLWGSNSDSYGFAKNLDDFVDDWAGDCALVIGAGGASRAIIHALRERGFKKIMLSNRTKSRAENLMVHFNNDVDVIEWQDMNDHVQAADLIVNTTSLGLENHQQDANFMPIDFKQARRDVIINDIVYTPLNTPFLKAAAQEGLKTVDGIGMLLHQAIPGFERWFGVKPSVTPELRSSILQSMGEKDR